MIVIETTMSNVRLGAENPLFMLKVQVKDQWGTDHLTFLCDDQATQKALEDLLLHNIKDVKVMRTERSASL